MYREPDAYIRPTQPNGYLALYSMGGAPEADRLISSAGWPLSPGEQLRDLQRYAYHLGCVVTTDEDEYGAYVDAEA